MKIKAIFFDVDDTLYDLSGPFVRAYDSFYGEKYPVTAQEMFIRSRRRSDEVYALTLTGEMSKHDMYIYRMQKAFEDAGIQIPAEEALQYQEYYAACQRQISMTPYMKQWLEHWKGKIPMGVITNGPAEHQWNKVHDLGLLEYFDRDKVLVSEELGTAKPDPKIFELALERVGTSPEETCFVGDSFSMDMTGACKAGWKTIWMNHRKHEPLENGAVPDYVVSSEKEMCELIERLI